jgi:hypothetical protein
MKVLLWVGLEEASIKNFNGNPLEERPLDWPEEMGE